MKKLIVLPFALFGLTLIPRSDTLATHAESEEVVEVENEEEKEALDEIKAKLSEHLDKELVEDIFKYVFDGTLGLALVGIYIKYRKGKVKTLEDVAKLLEKLVADYIKANFEKLSEEQIKAIKEGLDKVTESNETIMKVLVLMQDSTSKGKVALLDFLGSKTNNKEVKNAAEEVTKEIEKQDEKKEEVNKAVEGEYKDIF